MPGQTSRQRSRRSRSSHRHDAKVRHYRHLLVGVSILFFVIYVFTWLYITRKEGEYGQTRLELRKQEITLAATSKELERVRKEKDVLVQGRIPGLLPLRYDETISIDNPYIRNIFFTQVKNSKGKIYEYHLVMNNDSLSVIRPQIQILLFSDTGIQIGEATVELKDPSTGTVRPILDPGEVRSHTAMIKQLRDEEPHYFLLDITEAKPASTERLREHLGNIISH
jgi:hypothetical protein